MLLEAAMKSLENRGILRLRSTSHPFREKGSLGFRQEAAGTINDFGQTYLNQGAQ